MHVDPKSLTFWDIEQVVDDQVDLNALKEFWQDLDHNQFSTKRVKNKVDHQTVKVVKGLMSKIERILPLFLVAFMLFFASVDLFADSASTLFKQAEKISVDHYEEGKTHYLVSAEKYIVEAKQFDSKESTGRLLYNAANAFFLADDLGHAILYYLRAEQLIPNDHQLFMNLKFVKNERVDDIQPKTVNSLVTSIFFFHYHWSPMVRFWFFVGFYLVLITLLFYKNQLAFVRGLRMFFLICTILLATSIIIHQHGLEGQKGVVVAREITAFKGPGPLYKPAFLTRLHAGTIFNYLGSDGDWIWVELEDGKQCWLSKKGLESI